MRNPIVTLVEKEMTALRVMRLFDRLKLIITVDYAVPLVEGGWMIVFEYVRRRLACLSGLADMQCLKPPLLRGGGHAQIVDFLTAHQEDLRSFLRTAPPLIFGP
jgi:hypothetical protein